jgi:hypothetical protein
MGQCRVADEATGPSAAGTVQGRLGLARGRGIGSGGIIITILLRHRPRDGPDAGRRDNAAHPGGGGSLMRHFLARAPTAAIAGLPGGVVAAAASALLIAPARGPQRGVPRLTGTGPRAVAIAPVTPAAQEEDLTAVCAVADDEPERVHAPHGPGAGGGQSRPDMGRQGRAESTRPARFGPRARGGKTPGPHPPAPSARTALPQRALRAQAPRAGVGRPTRHLSRLPRFPAITNRPRRDQPAFPGGGPPKRPPQRHQDQRGWTG